MTEWLTIQDHAPGWDIKSRAYVGKGDLDDSVVTPRISTSYEVVAYTEQEAFKLLWPSSTGTSTTCSQHWGTSGTRTNR